MEQAKQTFSLQTVLRNLYMAYEIAWNVFLVLVVLLICAVCFSFGLGAGYFASLVKDMPIPSYKEMRKDIYNYEETSHIYFANNVYLGSFRSDLEREEVRLKDVSPHVLKAIIATEDEYFYEHRGIAPDRKSVV